MDLEKLTPAESWHPENWDAVTLRWLHGPDGAADLEFLKLARNAFDVMMRRGWTAHYSPAGKSCWLEADDVGRGGVDTDDWHPQAFEKWLDS